MKQFAAHQLDFYKTGHAAQYPAGTESVYANFTMRSGNHSNIKYSKGGYIGGMQLFYKAILQDLWNDTFFGEKREIAVNRFVRRISGGIPSFDKREAILRMNDLHSLGYLPIVIKSLPEGSFVPYKVPYITIRETVPEFFWVSQMLESVMSTYTWPMINTMTTAAEFLRVAYQSAQLTGGDMDFVPYQIHDFSYRGMFGGEAGAMSGLAMLLAGVRGTDTVPALDFAEEYYNAEYDKIGGSIPATEHSVMCAGGKEHEFETFVRLISEVYPSGNVSIVSDTWNYWNVMGNFLPRLKPFIDAREGTVVFRPDSGDPVKIVCGDPGNINVHAAKGTVQCQWDVFGGETNTKGFKVLNPKVNCIYGDSITLDRQQRIYGQLQEKGFCPRVVLGVGSYSLQGNSTRDTHGIAMKATNTICNGKSIEIFKDPMTDDGVKKSLKGLIMVSKEGDNYTVEDQVTPKQEARGCLQVVFRNSNLESEVTLDQVRERVTQHILKQI